MITVIRLNPETQGRSIEIVDGVRGILSRVAIVYPQMIAKEHGEAEEIAQIIRKAIDGYISDNPDKFPTK